MQFIMRIYLLISLCLFVSCVGKTKNSVSTNNKSEKKQLEKKVFKKKSAKSPAAKLPDIKTPEKDNSQNLNLNNKVNDSKSALCEPKTFLLDEYWYAGKKYCLGIDECYKNIYKPHSDNEESSESTLQAKDSDDLNLPAMWAANGYVSRRRPIKESEYLGLAKYVFCKSDFCGDLQYKDCENDQLHNSDTGMALEEYIHQLDSLPRFGYRGSHYHAMPTEFEKVDVIDTPFSVKNIGLDNVNHIAYIINKIKNPSNSKNSLIQTRYVVNDDVHVLVVREFNNAIFKYEISIFANNVQDLGKIFMPLEIIYTNNFLISKLDSPAREDHSHNIIEYLNINKRDSIVKIFKPIPITFSPKHLVKYENELPEPQAKISLIEMLDFDESLNVKYHDNFIKRNPQSRYEYSIEYYWRGLMTKRQKQNVAKFVPIENILNVICNPKFNDNQPEFVSWAADVYAENAEFSVNSIDKFIEKQNNCSEKFNRLRLILGSKVKDKVIALPSLSKLNGEKPIALLEAAKICSANKSNKLNYTKDFKIYKYWEVPYLLLLCSPNWLTAEERVDFIAYLKINFFKDTLPFGIMRKNGINLSTESIIPLQILEKEIFPEQLFVRQAKNFNGSQVAKIKFDGFNMLREDSIILKINSNILIADESVFTFKPMLDNIWTKEKKRNSYSSKYFKVSIIDSDLSTPCEPDAGECEGSPVGIDVKVVKDKISKSIFSVSYDAQYDQVVYDVSFLGAVDKTDAAYLKVTSVQPYGSQIDIYKLPSGSAFSLGLDVFGRTEGR